ncbi:MAG TPA: ABC transporter permease, partial [Pyrinomonadaceae bacterium]|nr:ABC transporter permease [Pyrinomonadaceae bacterium]
MRTAVLLKRNLTYYWRTNLAVVFGVAAAVAVLAGALVVGDSVRASLRDLFLQRLGRTDHVIASAGFFREQLAGDLRANEGFAAGGLDAACPLIVTEGAATHEESGRRGTRVIVYGVDERFWKFHGRENAQFAGDNDAFLSAGLGDELKARAGDVLLLRMEKPSAIPIESLHGRKEDVGRTIRLTVRGALDSSALGEFSVRPQQSSVRAVFVPLMLLQKILEQDGKVNTILVSARDAESRQAETEARTAKLRALLKENFRLEDLGIKLRALTEQQAIAIESETGLVGDSLAETIGATASKLGMGSVPVFSYLANTIRSGGREIPYSLVTAFGEESFQRLKVADSKAASGGENSAQFDAERPVSSAPSELSDEDISSALAPIILNSLAANDLGVKTGDVVTLEYLLWADGGRLVTQSTQFRLAGVVPVAGEAADRDLVPE